MLAFILLTHMVYHNLDDFAVGAVHLFLPHSLMSMADNSTGGL